MKTATDKKMRSTSRRMEELERIRRDIMGEWKGGYVPHRSFGMVRAGPADIGEDWYPSNYPESMKGKHRV